MLYFGCCILVFCFLYDMIEELRGKIPHGFCVYFLEELSFWILVTYQLFCVLQVYHNGVLRWFHGLICVIVLPLYQKGIKKYLIHRAFLLIRKAFVPIKKVMNCKKGKLDEKTGSSISEEKSE